MISSQRFVHTDACLGHGASNSAIHNDAGYLVTSRSQNATGRNEPQRLFPPLAPIHNLWDTFQWNGRMMVLYQSNHGMVGNCEAGGFVNPAVNTTKNPAVRFMVSSK